jgi:uncharacterized pyridoxamine 5'-phosphate oxidase family protein
MNEVVKFFNENPVQYLGTTDKDGNPKVRPFQFMIEKGGKLFFCTSNRKNVYAEIQNNPNVEFCVASSSYAWIRVSGKVVFSNDLDIKAALIEHSPLVKSIYETPGNPIFEILYLENATAVIADFSGQPPRTIEL